jgi:hypothetical protein
MTPSARPCSRDRRLHRWKPRRGWLHFVLGSECLQPCFLLFEALSYFNVMQSSVRIVYVIGPCIRDIYSIMWAISVNSSIGVSRQTSTWYSIPHHLKHSTITAMNVLSYALAKRDVFRSQCRCDQPPFGCSTPSFLLNNYARRMSPADLRQYEEIKITSEPSPSGSSSVSTRTLPCNLVDASRRQSSRGIHSGTY